MQITWIYLSPWAAGSTPPLGFRQPGNPLNETNPFATMPWHQVASRSVAVAESPVSLVPPKKGVLFQATNKTHVPMDLPSTFGD